ncbi:MAG: hypothetical protein AAFY03_00860 [Pseudomonadota bacterium]
MGIGEIAAVVYAISCVAVMGFQVALIAGAPWGEITQGGRHKGPLPLSGRVASGISIVILVGLALGALSAAGLWPNWPAWTGWIVVAIQCVVTLLNWITPSIPERRLWGPIETVMLGLILLIMFLG